MCAVVKRLEVSAEAGPFLMEVTWHDSVEVEEQRPALGQADQPVCWAMVGYASGYVSFCTGQEIFFIERKCRGKGDRICAAVGKDRQSWGAEVEPYIPYFQAEDIHGEVLRLTQELKEKMKEISRQRRRIATLEKAVAVLPVEVHSAAYRDVLELATCAAHYDSSVIITGESGVGKEVLARHMHESSPRARGRSWPSTAARCPPRCSKANCLDTRPVRSPAPAHERAGLFEAAHDGTIFLDEIGDVSPDMQTKLLRVLQEREIVRIGENIPRKVDIRIIAATNKDLQSAVRSGQFREDLYYRLGVIEIEVPPLRQCPEDILSLARHLVQKTAARAHIPRLRLDATTLDYLTAYPWPGNVRELENALERAAVFCKEGVIRPEDLPATITRPRPATAASTGVTQSLDEVERRHIQAVLDSVGGNRRQAAQVLGISTATLWRRLKR